MINVAFASPNPITELHKQADLVNAIFEAESKARAWEMRDGYCKVTDGSSTLYVAYYGNQTDVIRWDSQGNVTSSTFVGQQMGVALCGRNFW